MAAKTPNPSVGQEQPLVAHLLELRDRLLRMVLAVLLVFLVLFPFANDLYIAVSEPLRQALPEGSTMISTKPIDPFLIPFKLSLQLAIFIAVPFILYQFWAFVAPGLYRHEQRLVLPLLVSSTLLFYLGMAFAYFVVFPLVFAFMAGTTPDGVAMMTDISAYLDFVLALFFAFGVAFEIPIATILLVASGVTTPESLVSQRPYVIVGVFVVGMLLTPPDVISQTLLALPMWLLFELGIFFSRMLLRRRAATESADADMPEAPSTPAAPPAGGGRGGGALVRDAAGVSHGADPDLVVGREIDGGGGDDPDRWRPLTDAEMEEELDLMDAAASARADPPTTVPLDRVDEKIERANRLRELDNHFAARQVLYEVLEEGDESQRRVARNILNQLDEH
jgi:sec-independent protein translocase protein TatC